MGWNGMRPNVKVRVSAGHKGMSDMCHGMSMLLHGIDDNGSLYKVAAMNDMAYSKAWTMLRNVEDAFGAKLTERHGARGSVLTDEGRQIMDAYDAFEADMLKHADRAFAKHFGGLTG